MKNELQGNKEGFSEKTTGKGKFFKMQTKILLHQNHLGWFLKADSWAQPPTH